MGLNEEQLTIATQEGNWFQRQLAKLSTKRGKTAEAIKETKEGLNRVLNSLETSPAAQEVLDSKQTMDFLQGITTKLEDLPQNLRSKIQPDILDHFNKPLSGESLIKLYRKINHHIGQIGGDMGRKLGGVQEVIRSAISASNPQLGMEFVLSNKLYSTYKDMASKLKPTLAPDRDWETK